MTCLIAKHLSKLLNLLLGEIAHIFFSSSPPIALPFFGGHQKITHLPSNQGGVAYPPIYLGPLQLPLLPLRCPTTPSLRSPCPLAISHVQRGGRRSTCLSLVETLHGGSFAQPFPPANVLEAIGRSPMTCLELLHRPPQRRARPGCSPKPRTYMWNSRRTCHEIHRGARDQATRLLAQGTGPRDRGHGR